MTGGSSMNERGKIRHPRRRGMLVASNMSYHSFCTRFFPIGLVLNSSFILTGNGRKRFIGIAKGLRVTSSCHACFSRLVSRDACSGFAKIRRETKPKGCPRQKDQSPLKTSGGLRIWI